MVTVSEDRKLVKIRDRLPNQRPYLKSDFLGPTDNKNSDWK